MIREPRRESFGARMGRTAGVGLRPPGVTHSADPEQGFVRGQSDAG